MIINVKVKPGSPKELVKMNGDHLLVQVKEKAENNKANIALIKLLAKHYQVEQSQVIIKTGTSSPKKMVEIVI
jgi:hypothetical protein